MEKTTLDLPIELHRKLEAVAARTGRPESALIVEALELFLARWQRPMPRSIGMGHDPDLSGEDVEDWLKANWRPE